MKYSITAADAKIIEQIIQNGNRVEIIPVKDGIRIYEHERKQRK